MNWCWFTGHEWKVLSQYNFWDNSIKEEKQPSHVITFYCEKCKQTWIKTNWGGGFLDKDLRKDDKDD